MKFKISHISVYSYSSSVFFEPHYFRFKPKPTTFSSIEEFKIKIDPEPIGFSDQIDIENNRIRLCWFEDMHTNLRVEVNTVIDVLEYNPFNYLVHPPEFLQIPFNYSEKTKQLLRPSLQTDALSEIMQAYVNKVLYKSNNQTITFLTDFTIQIHNDFNLENRETGEPFDPAITFEQKTGSCRDLAWMQIHLLRHLGIASRFVSGYFYLDSDNPVFELHAWIEVFLPGAGWIGFDPSHGLVVGRFHIHLASSSFYEYTMPISGAIRGDANSTLVNDLKISIIS